MALYDENRKRTVDFVLVLGDLSQNSLTLRAATPRDDIKRAIKIGSSNIDFKNNIHYIPLFCSFLIKDYLATLK